MYKGRIVTRDFEHEHGIDYDEIFAPVVKWNTWRLIITTAVQRKWRIIQLGVKTTFLYGILHMEVYMFQAKKIRAWGKRVQGMFVTRSPLRLNTRGTHLEWNHRCVYTKSGASKNLCWFQSLPVNWIKFNRDSQPICLSTIFPSHKITVLSWRILKQHLYWPTTRCLPQANEKLSLGQFLEDHEGMLMTQKAFTWEILTLFGMLEASG